jgi:hypothetical protein
MRIERLIAGINYPAMVGGDLDRSFGLAPFFTGRQIRFFRIGGRVGYTFKAVTPRADRPFVRIKMDNQ